MKKFSLLLVLPIIGACALTEYPVITDEDQGPKVIGTHTVNTAGGSFIKQKLQVAIIKDGGETRESVWFVEQDGAGNQTIQNFINVGNISDFSTVFHGSTYMNNDMQGCWWVKAPNPTSEANDFVGIFNFTANASCSTGVLVDTDIPPDGKGDTPIVRVAKFERSMEAGKDPGSGGSDGSSTTSLRPQSQFGITLQQGLDVAASLGTYAEYGDWRSTYGLQGYKLTATPTNLVIELANSSGARTQIAFDGVVAVLDLVNGKAILDTRTGNMADAARAIGDWVEANGQVATVYVTFAGVTGSVDVGLAPAAGWRDLANRLD